MFIRRQLCRVTEMWISFLMYLNYILVLFKILLIECRLLGQHIDQNKLQRILDRSRAKDDDIDFPEFLKELDSFISDPCTEQELRRAFRVFDPENRGKVNIVSNVFNFFSELTIHTPDSIQLMSPLISANILKTLYVFNQKHQICLVFFP